MGQRLVCGAQGLREGAAAPAPAPARPRVFDGGQTSSATLGPSQTRQASTTRASRPCMTATSTECQHQEQSRRQEDARRNERREAPRVRRVVAKLEKDQREVLRGAATKATTSQRKLVLETCFALVVVFCVSTGLVVDREWTASVAAVGLCWLLVLSRRGPLPEIDIPPRPTLMWSKKPSARTAAPLEAAREATTSGLVKSEKVEEDGFPETESAEMPESGNGDGDLVLPAAKSLRELPRQGLQSTLADDGNGENEPLNQEQMKAIEDLYTTLKDAFHALVSDIPEDESFATYETCRRYLVAREWSSRAAEKQLRGTIKWRQENRYGAGRFYESAAARRNPWGWSMRPIGFSSPLGCPVAFTVFSHANERFNLEGSMEHLTRMLDAMRQMIHERSCEGLTPSAQQRQWVWVIDFHGFSLRDNNPRTGIHTADLLSHFPEFLNCIVLLNAPALFSGLYKIMCKLVDERVRNKVLFVSRSDASVKLKERFGSDIASWVATESEEAKATAHRSKRGEPRKYWLPPDREDEHDPRGTYDYVHGKWYLRTPGDQYEEDKSESS